MNTSKHETVRFVWMSGRCQADCGRNIEAGPPRTQLACDGGRTGSGAGSGALLTARLRGQQWPINARRPLVAGNWKMNGLKASAAELGKIMAGAADLWPRSI